MTATHSTDCTAACALMLYLALELVPAIGSWPSPSGWARSPGSRRSRPAALWVCSWRSRPPRNDSASRRMLRCSVATRQDATVSGCIASCWPMEYRNQVVDSSSIEVNRCQRRAKSDQLECPTDPARREGGPNSIGFSYPYRFRPWTGCSSRELRLPRRGHEGHRVGAELVLGASSSFVFDLMASSQVMTWPLETASRPRIPVRVNSATAWASLDRLAGEDAGDQVLVLLVVRAGILAARPPAARASLGLDLVGAVAVTLRPDGQPRRRCCHNR